MTSKERHERRYQRRVISRLAKKQKMQEKYDNFDKVFTYGNMMNSYRKCILGVRWKASTQRYILFAPYYAAQSLEELREGTYKSKGFFEFDLIERGKARHIRSVEIKERVIQRCLCDYALVPMITRTFIYDNGASIKNRGYSFAVNRVSVHLQKHYKVYGNDGYVLLFDFSKFFDNVSHEVVFKSIDSQFNDPKLNNLIKEFVKCFGNRGLGLGSQISQVLALESANRLDHLIKDKLGFKHYGRYMDDGYIISNSKKKLEFAIDRIKQVCAELGIVLNLRKTRIIKLSRGFTYLKVRFFVTPTGRIIKKIYKRSVTRMRRKLKSFCNLVHCGKMTIEDVEIAFQSWCAYASNFNAYHTLHNMISLYNTLFPNARKVRI